MSIFAPLNDIKHFHVTSLVHKTLVNVVAVNAGLRFEASMDCYYLPSHVTTTRDVANSLRSGLPWLCDNHTEHDF